MSDVTRIMEASGVREHPVGGILVPLVYDELRSLAAKKLSHEPTGHALQATAHEHLAEKRRGQAAQGQVVRFLVASDDHSQYRMS